MTALADKNMQFRAEQSIYIRRETREQNVFFIFCSSAIIASAGLLACKMGNKLKKWTNRHWNKCRLRAGQGRIWLPKTRCHIRHMIPFRRQVADPWCEENKMEHNWCQMCFWEAGKAINQLWRWLSCLTNGQAWSQAVLDRCVSARVMLRLHSACVCVCSHRGKCSSGSLRAAQDSVWVAAWQRRWFLGPGI